MIKFIVIICLVLLGFGVSPQTAAAHVLVKDETGQIGAILHFNPDDDPAAGENSTAFYDIQSKSLVERDYEAQLQITDDIGTQTDVPVMIDDNTVSADYNFPRIGAYQMQLVITSGNSEYILNYAQRVARGGSANSSTKPSNPVAEIMFITASSLFVVLCIVAYNRRAEITTQSMF